MRVPGAQRQVKTQPSQTGITDTKEEKDVCGLCPWTQGISLCARCHAEEEGRKKISLRKQNPQYVWTFTLTEKLQKKLNIYLEASILNQKRSSYFCLLKQLFISIRYMELWANVNQMKQTDIISKTFCELLCWAKDWLQICVILVSCPKGTCNIFQANNTPAFLWQIWEESPNKKEGRLCLMPC